MLFFMSQGNIQIHLMSKSGATQTTMREVTGTRLRNNQSGVVVHMKRHQTPLTTNSPSPTVPTRTLHQPNQIVLPRTLHLIQIAPNPNGKRMTD